MIGRPITGWDPRDIRVPMAVRPASGFDTGKGGYLLKLDVSGHNEDAPPFGISMGSYEQDSGNEPDNVGFRLGFGAADTLNLAPPLGSAYYATLNWETSYFEASKHNHEFYYQVGPTDGVSPDYVRPIFFKMDVADIKDTLTTNLAGAYVTISDTSSNTKLFSTYAGGYIRFRLDDGQPFSLCGGQHIDTANKNKGAIHFKPHSESAREMEFGYIGGADEIFAIGGFVTPPERLHIGLHANGALFTLRKRSDDGTSFGFGKSTLSTDDNASVHFAGYLNIDEITAPGDPASGQGRLYIDTNGDLVAKINHGGTTKTVTLVDWSAA